MVTERSSLEQLSSTEEGLFRVFSEGYGLDEQTARQLAGMLAPSAGNFNTQILSDIVWAAAHWGSLKNKPFEIIDKGAEEVIQWLTQPQGFTWARQQAAPERFPIETERAQQAFMQDEIRRLGLAPGRTPEEVEAIRATRVEQVGLLGQERVKERARQREVGIVAGERRDLAEELRQFGAGRDVGDIPTTAQVTQPFLERLGIPAATRFFRQRLPGIIAGAGIPAARGRFFEEGLPTEGELGRLEREYASGLKELSRLRRLRKRGGIDLEGEKDLKQRERSQEPLLRRIEKLRETERGKLRAGDPLKTFLGDFPFLEKFKAATPSERGFSSRQFRPRTRFLNF